MTTQNLQERLAALRQQIESSRPPSAIENINLAIAIVRRYPCFLADVPALLQNCDPVSLPEIPGAVLRRASRDLGISFNDYSVISELAFSLYRYGRFGFNLTDTRQEKSSHSEYLNYVLYKWTQP